MRCAKCGYAKSDVKDSRISNEETGEIRRRRHCQKCGHRFTTYEVTQKMIAEVAASRVAQRAQINQLKKERDEAQKALGLLSAKSLRTRPGSVLQLVRTGGVS